MSFNTKLTDILKSDPRFVDEDGELILAAVQDSAWKIDRNLIKLLLSDDEMKSKFFEEIEGYWVFNQNLFLEYVSQKDFLDNSYTRFRNRIGLTIDGKYLRERGEVALAWPYKDGLLEGGQTKDEEKRRELFFNEVLAQDEITRLLRPKVLTSFERYSGTNRSNATEIRKDEAGNLTDNLIIKGNNLQTLSSIRQLFRNKVKFIYIDPPYNIGTDSFRYNDNFSHSTWLTFMKNRLEVAKDTLKQDGALFISCDDVEQAYLKVLCDEIFGRNNFIATMPWKGRGGRQDATHVSDIHEFILFYAKDKNSFVAGEAIKKNEKFPKHDEDKQRDYKTQLLRKWGSNSRREDRPNLYYPIPSPEGDDIFPLLSDGEEGCWRWGKKRMFKEIELGNVEFSKQDDGSYIPYQKIYAPEDGKHSTKKFTTWIETDNDFWLDDVGTTSSGSNELKQLLGYKAFDYPKPTSLIKRLLRIGNVQDDDIILDFFPGSGTTAHAVIDFCDEEGISLQFILCEQMEYVKTITVKRVVEALAQVGEGDFLYCELMPYNQVYVDRIQAAQSSDELLKLWSEIAEHSFLNWYVNPEVPEDAIKDFMEIGQGANGHKRQKHLLLQLLDKNQLYVNLSEIDDTQFEVTEEDKKMNQAFYGENYHA